MNRETPAVSSTPTAMCARPTRKLSNSCPPVPQPARCHALFPADTAPWLAPLDPGQRFSPARLPRARLARMGGEIDEGGFELTVLYPTRFMHIGQIGNPPYAVELCRAITIFA